MSSKNLLGFPETSPSAWQEYYPETNSTNEPSNIDHQQHMWRRVNDTIEVRGWIQWVASTTTTDGQYRICFPNGLKTDWSKVPTSLGSQADNIYVIGTGFFSDAGIAVTRGLIGTLSGDGRGFRFFKTSVSVTGGYDIFEGANSGGGDFISYTISAPIASWG